MGDLVLYIDRVLWPVTSLGPGRRVVIWVSGCGHQCYRCANPELWTRRPEQMIPVNQMKAILSGLCTDKKPDGLTITGGEPFDQAEALSALLDGVSDFFADILVYSGYKEEALKNNTAGKELLRRVDVLIDGPYIDKLNRPSIVLRGSENQRICYQNVTIKETYEAYLQLGRQIQNYVYDYRILSVGIHSNTEHGYQ